ncbi:zinc finger (CCCH type) motif-containing protein [Cardiosporidium cionae]|uniref:Zinc finger (CCCH type) motif-containing protein n=1 Tax=Cardiosporidium cionae TaxID=476202 RepID=A0ABQ7JE56_9APIC|nr:zinc finger (CCCH type) motif-containing protein [Cardiosporidium cionae]|eukprot:KAF8822271.1 zinc finger (CCCH type) motif-containing protein [Cardiosporidium cionae]
MMRPGSGFSFNSNRERRPLYSDRGAGDFTDGPTNRDGPLQYNNDPAGRDNRNFAPPNGIEYRRSYQAVTNYRYSRGGPPRHGRDEATNYQADPGGRSRFSRPTFEPDSIEARSTQRNRGGGNPGSSGTTKNFCNFFATSGKCKYGAMCMFRHEILRVEEVFDRKIKSISCCEVAKIQDGQLEVYTATKDGNLTRWNIFKDESSGNPKIVLKTVSTFEASMLSCVFHEECLFCGMNNGKIIVLHTGSGDSIILEGHDGAIYALIFIDHILISGGWDGQIKLWEFNGTAGRFNCVKTIQTGCKITCMRELSIPTVNPSETRRSLWVGGTILLIVDLSSLEVVRTLDLHEHVCVSLVKFKEAMVVGFAAGFLKIYSMSGEVMNTYYGSYLSCLEGMLVQEVPILLYGTDKGYINTIKLPELKDAGCLKGESRGIGLKRIIDLGESYFLTCGEDGHLSIWKWLS